MGKDAVDIFFKTLEKEGLKKAEITSEGQSYRYLDGEIWEKSYAKGETVDLYDAAVQLKEKGETHKAITLLEVLLRTQPNHVKASKLFQELKNKAGDAKDENIYWEQSYKRKIGDSLISKEMNKSFIKSKLTIALLAIIAVMTGMILIQWLEKGNGRPAQASRTNQLVNGDNADKPSASASEPNNNKTSPPGSPPGGYREKPDPNPVSDLIKQRAKSLKKNEYGFWEAIFENNTVMIYIPPGKFIMGSNNGKSDEKPAHEVYLDGYWIGKFEVTSLQFYEYAEKYFGQSIGKQPVASITWHDADNYCKWLSEKTGLNFKLPTEAQWEKAARGSDSRKYPWGDHGPFFNRKYYANYHASDNPGDGYGDNYRYIAPVGSYLNGASPYGCMDMAGNVNEWCRDWYEKDYYNNSPSENPTGPQGGPGYQLVIRGGDWNSNEEGIRCSIRYHLYRMEQSGTIGFRVAMTEKKEEGSSH